MFLDFSDGKGDKGKLFKLTQITKVLAPGHSATQIAASQGDNTLSHPDSSKSR